MLTQLDMVTDDTTITTGPQTPDAGWRSAIITAVTVWSAAALGYLIINGMVWMTRNESGPRFGDMLEVWNQWDTGHYVTIATSGYNPATENPAFFPLYSLVMRVLDPVLPGNVFAAGLIISQVCCVTALTLLYRLVSDIGGTPLAGRTVVALMAYPFAFYLSAAYNEALFLMLSLAALYAMRRSLWWVAGGLAGLASATRQAGVLLAVAFVVEYLRQRRGTLIRADALAVSLVPTGLVGYALYCWSAFGDPLKFVHVQSAWGREPTLPWLGAWRAFDGIVRTAAEGAVFQPVIVLNAVDLFCTVAVVTLLVLSVVGPWRLGRESLFLVAYGAASLLMILVSPIGNSVPLHGVPRYALEIVPVFMVLGRMTVHPIVERLYLMPALLVQGVVLLAFYYDIWIS